MRSALPVLLCTLLTVLAFGCDKSSQDAEQEGGAASTGASEGIEARACANMIRIMTEGMPEGAEMPAELADVDACLGSMDKNLPEGCKDRDAALTCMAEAADLGALMNCESHCTSADE